MLHMIDWIQTLGDAIFHIAELFMDFTRPKRLVGIWFAAITAFGVIGAFIAVLLGTNLDPLGFFVVIPLLLISSAIASYCILTDRAQ